MRLPSEHDSTRCLQHVALPARPERCRQRHRRALGLRLDDLVPLILSGCSASSSSSRARSGSRACAAPAAAHARGGRVERSGGMGFRKKIITQRRAIAALDPRTPPPAPRRMRNELELSSGSSPSTSYCAHIFYNENDENNEDVGVHMAPKMNKAVEEEQNIDFALERVARQTRTPALHRSCRSRSRTPKQGGRSEGGGPRRPAPAPRTSVLLATAGLFSAAITDLKGVTIFPHVAATTSSLTSSQLATGSTSASSSGGTTSITSSSFGTVGVSTNTTTTSCNPLDEYCAVYEPLTQYYPPQISPHCGQIKCEIPALSGEFIGACQNEEYIQSQISFCKTRVCYDACVPPIQYLHPEWTLQAKDRLVERRFKALVEERIRREVNDTKGIEVPMLFTYNADCIEAFKDALCYLNFPKCGCKQESLPMCETVCQNYYNACGGAIPNENTGAYVECSRDFIVENGLFASYTGARKKNETSENSRDGLLKSNWAGDGIAGHSLAPFIEECPQETSDMRRLFEEKASADKSKVAAVNTGPVSDDPASDVDMEGLASVAGGVTRRNIFDKNHRMLQQMTQACRDASVGDVSAVGGGINPDNLQVSAVEKPEDPSLLPAVLCLVGLFLVVVISYVMTFVDPGFDQNKRLLKIVSVPLALLTILFILQYIQLTLEAGKVASPEGSPVVLACIEGKQRVSGTCAKRLRWPQVTQMGCSTSCTGDATGKISRPSWYQHIALQVLVVFLPVVLTSCYARLHP